jgi:hypothetical protein
MLLSFYVPTYLVALVLQNITRFTELFSCTCNSDIVGVPAVLTFFLQNIAPTTDFSSRLRSEALGADPPMKETFSNAPTLLQSAPQ